MGTAGNAMSKITVTIRTSSGGFSFGTRGAMKMKTKIRGRKPAVHEGTRYGTLYGLNLNFVSLFRGIPCGNDRLFSPHSFELLTTKNAVDRGV